MDNIFVLTIYLHIGVVNSGRHDSPYIPEIVPRSTIPAGKIGGVSQFFQKYSTLVVQVFTSVTHMSPSLTASQHLDGTHDCGVWDVWLCLWDRGTSLCDVRRRRTSLTCDDHRRGLVLGGDLYFGTVYCAASGARVWA